MKKREFFYDTAENGLVAFETYKKHPGRCRFILMGSLYHPTDRERRLMILTADISMPVMDGLESSRQIRNFERSNHLPPATIIALTGLASKATQQEAFASGI